MKLVTIHSSVIKLYKRDPEMLLKEKRPCALIMRLKYKGHNYSFAVPLRSNIAGSAPKETYFPLPPRSSTHSGNRHGVHYVKMFPVDKSHLIRYRTEGNMFASLIKGILDKNEKQIIRECQDYLDKYERGIKYSYCTDIDLLLSLINQ